MAVTNDNLESRYLAIKKYIVSLIQESLGIASVLGQASTTPTSYSAPIYRLPVEVLCEIFSSLGEDSKYWRPRGPPLTNTVRRKTLAPNVSLDPAVLAQVCMLWRAIVLSTPSLWSSLAIHCTRKQPTLPLLETWLERSGDKDLKIVFVESIHGFEDWRKVNVDEPSNPFASEVMTLLMAHSHRWKAVDFSFARRIPDALLKLQPGTLPILETAGLSSRYTISHPYEKFPPLETVWNAFNSSPKLTRGRWEVEYLQPSLDEIKWSRLTSIEVTMTVPSLFLVLPELMNLVDLHFIDPNSRINSRLIPLLVNREQSPPTKGGVTLPHLRNLRLETAETADEIFEKLTLPSLASVHVEQRRVWLHRPDPSVFTELLLRSGCSLKEYIYDISGDPIAEDILLDILSSQTMSDIEYLHVQCSVADKLTRFLTRKEDNRTTLPHLEDLSLEWCKDEKGGLLVMAQSRSRKLRENGLAALRHLQVHRCEKSPVEEEGFKQLAEEGMIVKL